MKDIEKRWDLENELREMVEREAIEKVARVAAKAARGLIGYHDMMAEVEHIDALVVEAKAHISALVWETYWI